MQDNGKKKRILIVGPSDVRSKGGMATVIRNIRKDRDLNEKYTIAFHESYIDGNMAVRLLYSVWGFLKFLFIYRGYDLYHLHVVSNGSAYRALMYVNVLRRHHKNVIFHMHVAVFKEFYEGLSNGMQQKIKRMLEYGSLVIVLSDAWKDVFVDEVGLKNVVVLNNGIDTEEYAKAVSDPDRTAQEFLFLGRVGHRKGAYDLLDACELIHKEQKKFHCVMAGDGEVDKFKVMIRERGLEGCVEMAGWTDGEKKMQLLKQVSTVVLPSYNEGLPMTLLESMAAGKAVITTNVGSIPELVKDPENGTVLEPGNVRKIADAMIFYSEHPEVLKKMASVNMDRIEQEFSLKSMHALLDRYYVRALERENN